MSLKAFFKSFQFTNKRKKSKIKQTNNKKVNLTKYFMLPRNCIVYNICLSGKKFFLSYCYKDLIATMSFLT
jgi:hypothetical protein